MMEQRLDEDVVRNLLILQSHLIVDVYVVALDHSKQKASFVLPFEQRSVHKEDVTPILKCLIRLSMRYRRKSLLKLQPFLLNVQ